MEELLWTQPERLLGEPLRPLRRQASGEAGRTELIFVDRSESLLIVEVRQGKLERGAIAEVADRRGVVKKEFPDRAVEMMVVANQIPAERRLACERLDIEAREIPESRFREAASEAGHGLVSEQEAGAPAAEAEEGDAGKGDRSFFERAPDPFSGAIPAEVMEEAADEHVHEEPPAMVEETTGPYRTFRRRRRHSTAGTLGLMLGLLAVGVVAFLFRQELTEGYDRLKGLVSEFFSSPTKEPAEEPAPVQPESEPAPKPRPGPKARPIESDNGPEEPLPHFEPVTRPPPPAEEPLPEVKPKERYPGLAYSIIERTDLSRNGVFEYEMKVVVPANYNKNDLLRMASNIVGVQLKEGLCHAVHFYCFADKKKTNPEDAFAEVIWAPEGNLARAAEAVRAGSDKNEYRVVIIRTEP